MHSKLETYFIAPEELNHFLLFRFVAKNNEALRRNVRRSLSPKRSRSRSPYKYRYNSRSRSRSPLYKTTVSHIARKRSPEKAYNKFSRSPRRRSKSLEKRVSPKYVDNRRNNRPFNYNENGNGRRPNKDSEQNQDRKVSKVTPKSTDQEKIETCTKDEPTRKSKSPSVNSANVAGKSEKKREKTEQELEDELLASTDSEQSDKEIDDDEFKLTVDKEDLDFLDDDEEESENEGRFKSKPTTSATQDRKTAMSNNNFKPSFSRGFEKSNKNDKSFGRNDYNKRYRYNDDSRREKKRSRSLERKERDEKTFNSPIRKQQKKSPEARKSPEAVRKNSTKDSTKVIVFKNVVAKEEPKKIKIDDKKMKIEDSKKVKNDEPMFKSTFKVIEPTVNERKKGEYGNM